MRIKSSKRFDREKREEQAAVKRHPCELRSHLTLHKNASRLGVTRSEEMPTGKKHRVYLANICLRSTFFSFQEEYCEQTKGAAMGSPFRAII